MAEFDPTADFLAREKELLGDDADMFSNEAPNSAPVANQAPLGNDFSAFEDSNAAPSSAPVPASQSPFQAPVLDTSSVPVDSFGQPIDFGTQPLGFSHTGGSAASGRTGFSASSKAQEDEPEAIKEWRKTFAQRIADIDARNAKKHEAILKKAKEDLERFYAEYEEKKKKMIGKTREHSKEEPKKGGLTWDRVLRQIESTPSQASADKKEKAKIPGKEKDTSRMKALMVNLRSDAQAPGNVVA